MESSESIENKLGFDQVRVLLKSLCLSAGGERFVEKMNLVSDAALVQKLQQQTAEMVLILEMPDALTERNFMDAHQVLHTLKVPGGLIELETLHQLKLALQTINIYLSFFGKKNSKELYPTLSELCADLKIDDNLMKLLHKSLDEHGAIRDNASTELYNIRASLREEQQALRKIMDSKLRAAIQDSMAPEDMGITIRNGRMVLPIWAEYKRKVKGLVYGESATGQTVFIEPVEVFEYNNRITELELEERREMVRIMSQICDVLRENLEMIGSLFRLMSIMDFVRAKAKLARKTHSSRPQVVPYPYIHLYESYHPLLKLHLSAVGKDVVPLTLDMEAEKHVLILSGPNAGGKSVVIKTVGLVQYMHQCGLLVPRGEGCTLGIFKHIFIDIGDNQSIDNDLSTYSSHLKHMKEVLAKASPQSLVLLDEFGTGTDPLYGGAIAESILEELYEKKAFCIINTHYANIKAFANNQPRAQNAAMLFDTNTLSPLYKLEMGKPGNSFALEIAQKIGLPAATLDKARKKIGPQQIKLDQLIVELQKEKQKLQQKLQSSEERLRNMQVTIQQYEELKTHLEKTKKEYLTNARAEAKKIIQDTRMNAAVLIKELKEAQSYEAKKVEEIRGKIRSQESELDKELKSEVKDLKKPAAKLREEVQVGDMVQIAGTEGLYKVKEILGKEATLLLGEMVSTVKLDRLTKVGRSEQKELKTTGGNRVKTSFDINAKFNEFHYTLDLRGRKAEDALAKIDAWLDDALIVGASELRILHGKGEGVLRKLVREQLKRNAYIKSLRDEHVEFGGDGVTIIELK